MEGIGGRLYGYIEGIDCCQRQIEMMIPICILLFIL